jgi:hypothetical protein
MQIQMFFENQIYKTNYKKDFKLQEIALKF